MKVKTETPADVGVIVGRFQVHELHEAHINLIQSVCDIHNKVIIFLGLSPSRVTRNNPLDFESRKQMILEKFPKAIVLYIKDNKSDETWSKNIDQQISDIIGPGSTVVLYGSRDSFISHYSGKFKTQELMQEVYVSGTEVRKSIGKAVKNSASFRAGVIWAAFNQYPKVFATVDVAIFNEDKTKILLARKTDETEYRFIGGFAEPSSESYEQDAIREVHEEAGIEVSEPQYIGSFYVKDWRYEYETDKIKTIFFACKHIYGRPTANDDICEVRWFDVKDFKKNKSETGYDLDILVENHRAMMKMLLDGYKKLVF